MKIEVANDHQIFCGMMNILQKLLKLFKKGCSTGGWWSIYIQKVKGFFEIFKGGAGLCWSYERIQSIFDKKAQSSTASDLLWLLIEIVAWWVISDRFALVVSGLIQVSDMAKRSVSLSEINYAIAGYLLRIELIFA